MMIDIDEIFKKLDETIKKIEEMKKDLQKEMATGELIYESICHNCKKVAEKIIEDDGVINCWDDMLKRHPKQSEVQ